MCSGAFPPQNPARQPPKWPKELRSITLALRRHLAAKRASRPWTWRLQKACLPSHPALEVGSLNSEVLDQNHILAPGLQKPLPPFSPSHPTSQHPVSGPEVTPLLLLGCNHHPPHLPPEDTAGVSGAHVNGPGSSLSQSPAVTLPNQGAAAGSRKLHVFGPAFILPGLTEFSGACVP